MAHEQSKDAASVEGDDLWRWWASIHTFLADEGVTYAQETLLLASVFLGGLWAGSEYTWRKVYVFNRYLPGRIRVEQVRQTDPWALAARPEAEVAFWGMVACVVLIVGIEVAAWAVSARR